MALGLTLVRNLNNIVNWRDSILGLAPPSLKPFTASLGAETDLTIQCKKVLHVVGALDSVAVEFRQCDNLKKLLPDVQLGICHRHGICLTYN